MGQAGSGRRTNFFEVVSYVFISVDVCSVLRARRSSENKAPPLISGILMADFPQNIRRGHHVTEFPGALSLEEPLHSFLKPP